LLKIKERRFIFPRSSSVKPTLLKVIERSFSS
jgi:hypothetical protein